MPKNTLKNGSDTKDAFPAKEQGRTTVKAFGKISYYKNSKFGFAAQSFKTGTDNDGNFFFFFAFAQWADINFEDNLDEEDVEKAIDKIYADLHSAQNRETQEFDDKFDNEVVGVMRANALAHSSVSGNEAESGKSIDDLSKVLENSSDTSLMQVSGMGELEQNQVHQNKQDIYDRKI